MKNNERMKTNKLRRSKRESVIGGVSGGLGVYFDTDPVIFRILFVVLAFTGGGGVFIYLLMWIFVPKEEIVFEPLDKQYKNSQDSDFKQNMESDEFGQQNADDDKDGDPIAYGEEKVPAVQKKNGSLLGGTILIIVGIFFLVDDFFPWFNWEYLWPIALIVAGLAIIKINYDKK